LTVATAQTDKSKSRVNHILLSVQYTSRLLIRQETLRGAMSHPDTGTTT
jgi:hypothetical protein